MAMQRVFADQGRSLQPATPMHEIMVHVTIFFAAGISDKKYLKSFQYLV